MPRWCALSSLVVASMLLSGCGEAGPKRNAVAGTVSYKGVAVKYGSINFRSDDGKHVGSTDIKDGKYAIAAATGLPTGSYRVAVTYPDPKVPAPQGGEAPGVSTPVREMLPAKYNDKTELKADIKDGPNDAVNFELK